MTLKLYHIDPKTLQRGDFVRDLTENEADYIYTRSMKIFGGKVFCPIMQKTDYDKFGLVPNMNLTVVKDNGETWRY